MLYVARIWPPFLKVMKSYFRRVKNLTLVMMRQKWRWANSIIKEFSKTIVFMKRFSAVKTHSLNSVLLLCQKCPRLGGLKWKRRIDVISSKQKILFFFLFLKIKYQSLYPALRREKKKKTVFSHSFIFNGHEMLSLKKATICLPLPPDKATMTTTEFW